ncbi:MAG: hypothetical protein E5299_01506 [Burkholderia gladioli]|nr:MAG: hypothetical protein E5299_01506 [Burkholderia gladioli]
MKYVVLLAMSCLWASSAMAQSHRSSYGSSYGSSNTGSSYGHSASQGFNSSSYAQPVHVGAYARSNGEYVQPHYRTQADDNRYNNYSTKGNVNPYIGQPGTVNPYEGDH